jgi:hypothetical protein
MGCCSSVSDRSVEQRILEKKEITTMKTNTSKINSPIHFYLFSFIAVAFVLASAWVSSSLAQSSADRDDVRAGPQPKLLHAISGSSADRVKTPPPPSLTIDSFKVGPFSTHTAAASGTNIKNPQTNLSGTEVIGGSRVSLLTFGNPDKQPVALELLPAKPALIYSAGYNVSPGLELHYTIPAPSANLSSKYDRFLIDFDGLDHGLVLTIVAWGVDKKVDGHSGDGCTVLPPEGPFTVSYPFSHITPDVLKTTTDLAFIFSATSRGLDYALTKISASKGDPLGRHIVTCAK